MEWEAQELQQQPQHHNQNQNGVVVGGGSGGLYVKVMTDEQMELLRRQISVYATICEQLVEMHKAITTQQDLAGLLPSLLLPLDFFFLCVIIASGFALILHLMLFAWAFWLFLLG